MKNFSDFVCDKILREFAEYLSSEYNNDPDHLQVFVEAFATQMAPRNKPTNMNLNIDPNAKKTQMSANGYPAKDTDIDPSLPQTKVFTNHKAVAQNVPDADWQGLPQPEELGSQPSVKDFGGPAPGTGSKFVTDAIKQLMPNIVKTAHQRNPGSVKQVQQVIAAFQDNWNAFKKQIPQILGASGVKNPQKHGLS